LTFQESNKKIRGVADKTSRADSKKGKKGEQGGDHKPSGKRRERPTSHKRITKSGVKKRKGETLKKKSHRKEASGGKVLKKKFTKGNISVTNEEEKSNGRSKKTEDQSKTRIPSRGQKKKRGETGGKEGPREKTKHPPKVKKTAGYGGWGDQESVDLTTEEKDWGGGRKK